MSAPADMPGEALRAEGLRPAGLPAGENLDIALTAGSITAIIGPAGIGKSAWLQTLAGLRRPAAGSLCLCGVDPAQCDATVRQNLRTRVGYVSADAPLLSNLDARMNIMLPRLYHRHEAFDVAERAADELLDALGYRGPRDQLPVRLNRLERLQVQIARALALDPELLFVDEPFNLEMAGAWPDLGRRFAALAAGRRALVIATGNLHFVAARAGRVLFVTVHGVREYPDWRSFAAAAETDVATFLREQPVRPEVAA